jgi:uncharacterized protein YceH (UPF0502 family)
MAPIESLAETEAVLARLIDRGYAKRLGRRPGQKEDRFEQLLGGELEASALAEAPGPSVEPVVATPTVSATSDGDLAARVSALETEVAALREELAALRAP